MSRLRLTDAIETHLKNERMKYEWSEKDGVFQKGDDSFRMICKRRMNGKYMISAKGDMPNEGTWFKCDMTGRAVECCDYILTRLHEKANTLECELEKAREMIDFFSEAVTGNGELRDAILKYEEGHADEKNFDNGDLQSQENDVN